MCGAATDRAKPRCRVSLLVMLCATAGMLIWTQVGSAKGVTVVPATAIPVQPVLLAKPKTPTYVWMEVTAYCPCKICCGRRASGLTASGKSVHHNGGRFVAADTAVLPFNTLVSIPGYHDGLAVPVIDTGSAIVGHRLDVFFPTHAAAEEWGRQMLRVRIDAH